jgi:hypothetical protein
MLSVNATVRIIELAGINIIGLGFAKKRYMSIISSLSFWGLDK